MSLRPVPLELSSHPRRVTLVSPVTGQLTTYARNKMLQAAKPRSAVDTIVVINQVNDECYAQGIDGWCSDVRHYSNDVVDYVEFETYLPEESLGELNLGGNRATLAMPVIISILAAVIAGIVAIWAVACTLKYYGILPEKPKIWAPNPSTGDIELMNWETGISALQLANPNMYVDPNTGAVFNPNTPGFSEFIQYYDSNLPDDWLQQPEWSLGSMVTVAVIGIAAVAAIYLGAKVVGKRVDRDRYY